jgi:hypothetical protein
MPTIPKEPTRILLLLILNMANFIYKPLGFALQVMTVPDDESLDEA